LDRSIKIYINYEKGEEKFYENEEEVDDGNDPDKSNPILIFSPGYLQEERRDLSWTGGQCS
jgi:hypothetical protein